MENPIDRGPWRATVHRVTNSWTWLKWLNTHTHGGIVICAWQHIFVWCESKAYSRPVFDYTVCLQSYTVNVRIMLHIQSISSVAQWCLTLRLHGLQHASLPCPSPTPGPCSNSGPSSLWCHPIISSSVVLFSCLQSCPASESFPMSQFFTSGGQNIGVSASASVLPVNIQDWFPLGWTGWISLQYLVTYSYIHKYKTIGKTCYKNHSGEKEWEYNT